MYHLQRQQQQQQQSLVVQSALEPAVVGTDRLGTGDEDMKGFAM